MSAYVYVCLMVIVLVNRKRTCLFILLCMHAIANICPRVSSPCSCQARRAATYDNIKYDIVDDIRYYNGLYDKGGVAAGRAATCQAPP